MTKEKIMLLHDAGLTTIHFSLNYSDAERYSEYYNVEKSVFAHLLDMIQFSNTIVKQTVVETIIFKETVQNLANLNHFVYSLGIKHHEIQYGITNNHWESKIDSEILGECIKDVITKKPNDMSIYFDCIQIAPDSSFSKFMAKLPSDSKVHFPKCIDGKNQFHIHVNGDVLICDLGYPKVIGNLLDGFSLSDIDFDACEPLKEFNESHGCRKYAVIE